MEKITEKLELIRHYFNDFTPDQLQQLHALEELYKDWNSKINVISRKDEESLYEKHVLHSLSIAAAFDLRDGMDVLDLGTGGGFPGIPLAIFFPDVNFYLADSIGKKIKVVSGVADALGLKNVAARQIRAEEIKDKQFDTVVSRAVASLGDLWRWSKPLLKRHTGPKPAFPGNLPIPHGMICLKGGELAPEIAASGCKPRMMEVYEMFPRPFFKHKYLLYVPV